MAQRRAPWLGPAIIAVTVAVAAVIGRRLWYFSDDWNIVTGYHRGNLLEPFNNHLSLVPVALFQLVFRTVGLGTYAWFRAFGLAAYAVLGAVTWRYARSRLGDVTAAVLVAALLWNSAGEANVMFPFLLNFTLPVAALAAIWWHLDRSTLRDDVMGSAWLAMALATSGLGLMVAVAVAVELAWSRASWRRWLVMAPGPALWALWYLVEGRSAEVTRSGDLTVRAVAAYAGRMVLGGFRSFGAGNTVVGVLAAVLFVGIVGGALVRRPHLDAAPAEAKVITRARTARVLSALAPMVVFATLTAVSRIGVVPTIPPDELRYRWTIGAYVVFVLIAALPTVLPAVMPSMLPRARLVLVGIATVIVVGNAVVLVGALGDWATRVDRAVPGVRANLWATEQAQAGKVLDRSRNLPLSFVQVDAGAYVDAVADLGSPLDGFDAKEFGGTADLRIRADQALVDDFAIAVTSGSVGGRICPSGDGATARQLAAGDTVPVGRGRGAGTVGVEPRAGAVDVSVSVFSSPADAPSVGTVQPGTVGVVDIPPVRGGPAGLRYRVGVSAPATVWVCAD